MIRPMGRLCLALSLAALLAGGVLPAAAAAVPAPEPASKERVDYLEKRLEDLKGEQRDLQQLLLRELDRVGGETDKSIAAQDKRVSDLQVILGQQGNYVSIVTIILAVAGLGAGFLGYKVFSNRAKEAKDAAGQSENFASEAKRLLDEIKDKHKEASIYQEDIKKMRRHLTQQTEGMVKNTLGINDLKGETAQKNRELLDKKSNNELTSKEWLFLAFNARSDDAKINALDELIQHYESNTNKEDLTCLAVAYTYKGTTLLQLDKPDEAMKCFEEAADLSGKVDLKEMPGLIENAKEAVDKMNWGRPHRPGAELVPPIHLEPEVMSFLSDKAKSQGTTLSGLVNQLLKHDIELLKKAG